MTKNKVALLLVSLGAFLLLAGCASHTDPSTVGAAPGVTPPATTAPPPPMTLRPGMMEKRRGLAPPAKP